VHIGHSAVVHCSKVGNNTLIGNNATILDGAEIGDFCIIGANSLVGEGMKIPDTSFVVGVPAGIKGEISAAQIARIEMGINSYLKLTQKYKGQAL
jgi:carbonic anhydrase/acetyltransferase-like protein (isoleucine patch superfamily)